MQGGLQNLIITDLNDGNTVNNAGNSISSWINWIKGSYEGETNYTAVSFPVTYFYDILTNYYNLLISDFSTLSPVSSSYYEFRLDVQHKNDCCVESFSQVDFKLINVKLLETNQDSLCAASDLIYADVYVLRRCFKEGDCLKLRLIFKTNETAGVNSCGDVAGGKPDASPPPTDYPLPPGFDVHSAYPKAQFLCQLNNFDYCPYDPRIVIVPNPLGLKAQASVAAAASVSVVTTPAVAQTPQKPAPLAAAARPTPVRRQRQGIATTSSSTASGNVVSTTQTTTNTTPNGTATKTQAATSNGTTTTVNNVATTTNVNGNTNTTAQTVSSGGVAPPTATATSTTNIVVPNVGLGSPQVIAASVPSTTTTPVVVAPATASAPVVVAPAGTADAVVVAEAGAELNYASFFGNKAGGVAVEGGVEVDGAIALSKATSPTPNDSAARRLARMFKRQ